MRPLIRLTSSCPTHQLTAQSLTNQQIVGSLIRAFGPSSLRFVDSLTLFFFSRMICWFAQGLRPFATNHSLRLSPKGMGWSVGLRPTPIPSDDGIGASPQAPPSLSLGRKPSYSGLDRRIRSSCFARIAHQLTNPSVELIILACKCRIR